MSESSRFAMTTFFVALGCLGFGFLLGRLRQAVVENRGEAAVRRTLMSVFPSPAYHLLDNVTLPVADGTTQIDHILVSRYGIFVIESKHYSGWLFGSAHSPQWTQVLFKKHYRFQNPLHQNRKHVLAVSRLLEFIPGEDVHSLVVFTGDATFKTPRPPGVVSLAELQQYIEGHARETMSQNRLQFSVGRIECLRMALTRQTDVEHVAHLNRKFGDPL